MRGALVLAPISVVPDWGDVLKAEKSPASSAPYDSALTSAWPGLIVDSPGRMQSTNEPGPHTFTMDPPTPSGLVRYVVACLAADVNNPSAATIVQLEAK